MHSLPGYTVPAHFADGIAQSSSMQVLRELVTPERARELLGRNLHNRPIKRRWVAQLTKVMREGKYQDTGDTVKVSTQETGALLLDGQHRLAAVAESGVPQWLWVAYGVEPVAQLVMDRGHRRTVGDNLAIEQYPQAVTLAAAVRWVVAMERKNIASKNERTLSIELSPEEVLAVLRERPEIQDSLVVKSWIRESSFKASPAFFAAAHFLSSSVAGREEADDFYRAVFKGDSLSAGTGPYLLREYLIRQASSIAERREPMIVTAHYTAISWNSWRGKGRTTKQLKFYPDQQFPGFR